MENLQKHIEHTNLRPTITSNDVELLVDQGLKYKLFGVCVPPFWVKKAKRDIGKSELSLVTVIGFPLGYQMTQTKVAELEQAIKDGADELDLVLNVSALKSEMHWPKIEIAKCSKLAHEAGRILKVIIETAYLTEKEIVDISKIAADAGADFIKTSTGFGPSGAKVEDIRLIKSAIPSDVGIKASGGIRTRDQAVAMIEAGAERIGTSNSLEILNLDSAADHS